MEYITTDEWNQQLWEKTREIYLEAFAGHGGKPEKIIHNMFLKKLCTLHLALDGGRVVAMAITGAVSSGGILLIDYLAVRQDFRKQGIGLHFFSYIKDWAVAQRNEFHSILLEVESENTVENKRRMQFWEKCGFVLIDNYKHDYKFIPELYQAMILNLRDVQPLSGQQLFTYISSFHRKSFRNNGLHN